jgi:hypothetical protein
VPLEKCIRVLVTRHQTTSPRCIAVSSRLGTNRPSAIDRLLATRIAFIEAPLNLNTSLWDTRCVRGRETQ